MHHSTIGMREREFPRMEPEWWLLSLRLRKQLVEHGIDRIAFYRRTKARKVCANLMESTSHRLTLNKDRTRCAIEYAPTRRRWFACRINHAHESTLHALLRKRARAFADLPNVAEFG